MQMTRGNHDDVIFIPPSIYSVLHIPTHNPPTNSNYQFVLFLYEATLTRYPPRNYWVGDRHDDYSK